MNVTLIQRIHLFFVGISLLAIFSSLLFSVFYLIQQWQIKNKQNFFVFSKLPSLEALDHYVVRSLVSGSIAMSVLLVTGIFLAHIEWNKDWIHDERFIVAVLAWGWSIFILMLRFRFGIRGEKFFYSIFIGMVFLVASCLLARMM